MGGALLSVIKVAMQHIASPMQQPVRGGLHDYLSDKPNSVDFMPDFAYIKLGIRVWQGELLYLCIFRHQVALNAALAIVDQGR